MATYIPTDLSRLVSVRLSPIVCKAICHVTDMSKVEAVFLHANEQTRQDAVKELQDLQLAASLGEVTSPQRISDNWISVNEAASLLGRTERTVRNYIVDGRLVSRKKNQRSYEVSRASVASLRTITTN